MAVAALVVVPFGVADIRDGADSAVGALVSGLAVALLSSVILYHEEQYSVRPASRDNEAAEPPCGAPQT
jgi:threonine/homoserine efflux transporter RhtA